MITKRTFQIILTTLIVLFTVDISLKILKSRLEVEKPSGDQGSNSLSVRKETRPYTAYAKIAERNLFQKAVFSTQEDGGDDTGMDHPVTDLKLTLKGTVVGTRERSFAIIEDGKLRTQNLYHVDDSISSGVTLSAIQTDRVIINRNGNKELLLMFQEDGTKKKGAPQPEPVARTDQPRTIERQEIAEASRDLKTLMRDVRIIPHFTAGKRDGFTVTYVRQGSRMQELGLQKNDIIKDINGTPAEDFRNIFEIFNKYSDTDTLDLGVERDNQILTISYTIE